MSSFTYPYFQPQRGVYLPWIMVRLGTRAAERQLSKPVVALVDSGAEVCFCSREIADYLGIELSKAQAQVFTTANDGRFTAYRVEMKLYVCRRAYRCQFYISEHLPKQLPIILGQRGFFDHHKVEFNFRKKEMGLTPS